jgi:hypothetical protein
MHARPRFSLRMLLGAILALCVVIGLMTNWRYEMAWVLVFVVSPGVTTGAATALLACLVRLAIDSAVPSRRQLIVCGVVGASLMHLLWSLGTHAPLNAAYVIYTALFFLSLSLWIVVIPVWLALRWERDAALLVEIRHAARLSLVVISSALVLSASLLPSTLRVVDPGPGLHPSRAGLLPIQLLVGCVGLVAAVPWIRVVRRRRVVVRRFGIAEYASLTALGGSILISLVTVGMAVIIWNGERSIGSGLTFLLLVLIYFKFPAVLTVVGVLIELWRDQWHPRLTCIACTWLIANWLFVCFWLASFN